MEHVLSPETERVRKVAQGGVETLGDRQACQTSPSAVANSSEANTIRTEIIAVGRKLWKRQYVDGNGGNISVRLGAEYVLCTPTMLSKGDIEPADICLSDLNGNIVAGDRLRTSELLLHLAIYRANPRARAVVHCHPPHATAFAMTGTAPPIGLVTEYEIFIGPAAVAPYETPGTQAFADTVLPYVQDHNTILLTNHGVVCWADTATHAEWLVEIFDTYCQTYLISQQIGKPLAFIPADKMAEILALKRRMGFPDARFGRLNESQVPATAGDSELERLAESIAARLDGSH
ncbi:MAG TPA: class II aldolase/adducin family protein [Terracidiphilus sp.]|jgi:L-fuculose-phosphate aldolase